MQEFRNWFNLDVKEFLLREMAYEDPITDGQQRYIYSLIQVWPKGINRKQASEIITLAKGGNLEGAKQLASSGAAQAPQGQQGQPQRYSFPELSQAMWVQ